MISLSSLLIIPLLGIFVILIQTAYSKFFSEKLIKTIGLGTSLLNFIVSLFIFIFFDFSSKQFQFIQVQEYHQVNYFDLYLGIDGLSIYFVLLTTIIIPIALLSNWTSIESKNVISFVVIILLLETLLLAVFLVLDILLFYVFFESILPPLFILIGLFGSKNKVRASFYFFLYTLLGSLFMLLSIITISSLMGTTDFDLLSKSNFNYITQIFLFIGIFISFAIKTPTIFLNTWLLKAHVESPLSGSIILAGIFTYSMLALNLAICWKNLNRLISRKLLAFYSCIKLIFRENIILILENIDYILFYYTDDNMYSFIHDHQWFWSFHFQEKDSYITSPEDNIINSVPRGGTPRGNINLNRIPRGHTLNNEFSSYLAGVIEGDGCIYLPKNSKGIASISIIFDSKDLPLALLIQKSLTTGNLYKKKGKNAYELVISNFKGLVKVINFINGYMRTPKIDKLFELIDWINNKNNISLNKLPLDNSDLSSNAWLAGFIESDGCFYVRVTENKNSKKKIACYFELAQKTSDYRSMLDIVTKISKFLSTDVKFRKNYNQFWLRTSKYGSNNILVSYLNSYPLFSSKYLDFLSWQKVLNIMIKKEQRTKLNTTGVPRADPRPGILNIKNNMNSKRTHFNWNHLQNFF